MKTLTQFKLPVLTGIAMFGLGLVSAFAQPVYPTSGTYTPGTTGDGLGQVAVTVPGRTIYCYKFNCSTYMYIEELKFYWELFCLEELKL